VVIGADVAPHTIIASGAVVHRRVADYDILGGVPAKQIGSRRSSQRPVVPEAS
jgi:acetyltransferase-like isoleucine patch superfamily enzyme